MSKYGVFSGLYFTKYGLNLEKYWTAKTSYLDTFHAERLTYISHGDIIFMHKLTPGVIHLFKVSI